MGLWELRVDGFDKDLKPIKGDNLRLARLMSEAKKNGEAWMLEQMFHFIKGLIKRDHPPLNAQEEEQLDLYVEFNLLTLVKELMIAFRWQTREQMEKLEQFDIKKMMLQTEKS